MQKAAPTKGPVDVPGMVYVPAGPFIMGSEMGEIDEEPRHQVYLDAFYIDTYEVTNAAYEKCIQAGKCEKQRVSARRFLAPTQPAVAMGWDNAVARVRWISTVITLVLPAIMAFMTYTTPSGQHIPVWRAIWPVFGATNQLLAGLALLAVTVWLKRTGRSWLFAGIPMVFMVGMTLTATVMLILSGTTATPVRVISLFLFVLGLLMVVEAFRSLRKPNVPPEQVRFRSEIVTPAPAVGD